MPCCRAAFSEVCSGKVRDLLRSHGRAEWSLISQCTLEAETSTYATYLRESSEHACEVMAVPHCQHHRAKVLHDHGSEPHQSPRVPTIQEGLAPASVGNS